MQKQTIQKITKRYKFLRIGLKSDSGHQTWEIGKWYICKKELDMCNVGFHCSKGIYQAFSYVHGEYLAEVEVKGKSIKQKDKEVWEQMRVVKVYEWRKVDSVLFAIYSANLVIDLFEKQFPNDNRPRKAIEAAQSWIDNPIKENSEAAADAAWAAWVAESNAARAVANAASDAESNAARAVANAASDAADAASNAARAVANAASDAARAAWAAANAASDAANTARVAIYNKLDKWMLNHVKELKEYKL